MSILTPERIAQAKREYGKSNEFYSVIAIGNKSAQTALAALEAVEKIRKLCESVPYPCDGLDYEDGVEEGKFSFALDITEVLNAEQRED